MSKLLKKRQRLASLAIVPLFSLAVMTGCGSDDDDDGPDGGTDPEMMVPAPTDANGDTVPDAFQSPDAVDSNGNTIDDRFDAELTGGADSNENNIDDSFEVALTEGDDANNDGIDDGALAELTGETVTDPDGGTDPDTMEPIVIDQTGDLAPVTILGPGASIAGVGNLAWDGNTLSGTVDVADGIIVNSASIDAGLAAANNGQQIVALNGSAPTLFVPSGMGSNTAGPIADNITSGNLFITMNLNDGSTATGMILLPGVIPKFAALSATNNIPAPEPEDIPFTTGAGFINVNTVTGQMTAAVRVDLNPSDLDADGVSETVSAVDIRGGAADATGEPLISLTLNGSIWTAQETLSTEQLSAVLEGNSYFSVQRTGGSDFIRGQIPAF